MRRLVPLLALLLILGGAPAAAAAVGPGRVAHAVGEPAPEIGVDATGPSAAVVLADGGAVLAGAEPGRGVVVMRLRPDGALEPAFGQRGIARLAQAERPSRVLQVLRRPDGRLVVVAMTSPRDDGSPQRFLLLGLAPDGAPDPAFGGGGVVMPAGVAPVCFVCEPAALEPDGALVLTGGSGPDGAWVVARLTADGARDPRFGGGGITELSGRGRGNGGFGAAITGGGRLIVLGFADRGMRLAALRPDGSADPGFHGGGPATVPIPYGFFLLAHGDGAIDVLGADHLVRFTAAGERDAGFGDAGVAALGPAGVGRQMLADTGGGTLVYEPASYEPRPAARPAITVQRVDRAGRIAATTQLETAFGGGFASHQGTTRILPALEQDGFLASRLLRRPDGSLLATGGVRVVRYSGEGEGTSSAAYAAAAFTASFAPDTRFGGPLDGARVSVALPRQRAVLDARLRRIRVQVTTNGPGLVLLRVRDGRRRILATSVEPSHTAGTRTVSVPLTLEGRRLLRRARRVRVLVGYDFRTAVRAGRGGALPAVLR